jgi:Flp pilus assembly protein CpaB
MVMTRSTNGGAARLAGDDVPRRVIRRSPGVPTGRALLGGLLVALSFLGMFLAWQQASARPGRPYAVASRPLRPGESVGADDVRFEAMRLPAGVAATAFPDAAALEGRVAVAPVRQGELLQAGALSDQVESPPFAELSLRLDRALAVDGHLGPGDLVDVYGSGDGGTDLVAGGVRIVAVSDGGGSFSADDQVTVTLALARADQQIAVIQADRSGTVTLVRTTHAAPAASATGATPSGTTPAGSGG